jgi:D-3-phosphoglycerate dehydrogenase
MTYRVLITAPYFQPVYPQFAETFRRHRIDVSLPLVEERLSEEQLLPLVSDIDGAICGDDAYTERVLAGAPKLRVICKWGTGIDSIDQGSCRRRGIKVCNTPNAFSEPVADTTVGYMLSFVRQLHAMTADMRSGRWVKISSRTLAECTIGLIGVGNVGRAVARRLVGFDARILAHDPVVPPASFLEACRVEMVDKSRLFGESDIVSLHCDLNPTSFHILDRAAFASMRSGSFLINTARGKLVDEPALVDALQEGGLAGAALDVFEDEPLPANSHLLRIPNVMLAPHNANSSPRAWEHVHKRTVENLIDNLVRKETR